MPTNVKFTTHNTKSTFADITSENRIGQQVTVKTLGIRDDPDGFSVLALEDFEIETDKKSLEVLHQVLSQHLWGED